jgi:hypothetical protein
VAWPSSSAGAAELSGRVEFLGHRVADRLRQQLAASDATPTATTSEALRRDDTCGDPLGDPVVMIEYFELFVP